MRRTVRPNQGRGRRWSCFEWRGGETPHIAKHPEAYEGFVVIKRELLPDGRQKLILKDPKTGDYLDRVVSGA